MGIFDFGDKPTTTTSSTAPQYAEELKPYLKEITEARKKLYEQRLEEGYQYYPGQTIAGLTPEEVAAQQGIKGLMGSQAPLQQEALNLQRGTARDFTPEEAQKYMSPYLRSSLDAQKAESQRQYERTAVPQFEAQAVAAGGMSGLGSRAGVEAAERATGQNRLLASIEAEGQQKAYEASQAAFRDQTARERQASAGIGKLSGDIFRGGTQELGLLQSIGEQKRDMSQSALDEAYLRYMQQQQYPEQQLNRYQSAIYGNPLNQQPSYTKTGTQAGGGPELGKTILGIGSALIPKFFAGGGGISSTMKGQMYNRNMGGPVMPPVMYRKQAGTVIPTDTVTRNEIGNVVAPTLVDKSRQQAFDANLIKDKEILSGLEAAPIKSISNLGVASPPPPVVRDDGSDSGARSASETGISQIGNWVSMNANKIASSISDQYTANSDVSKKQIASLAKEANAFEARSRERFDKYESLAKDLIGDDPNAERLFWYTVSAAIMKPGNAFANMAQGFKEATIAANTSREKKNKLLMQLSKDEMEFERDIDKLKSASTIQGINLTAKQEIALNKQPQAIRDEVMKFLLAGYKYNVAVAKARKESKTTIKPSVFNAIGKVFDRMVRMGIVGGKTADDGTFTITTVNGKSITGPQTKEFTELYNRAIQSADIRTASKILTEGLTNLGSTGSAANTGSTGSTTYTIPRAALKGKKIKKDSIITHTDGKRYKIIGSDRNNWKVEKQ